MVKVTFNSSLAQKEPNKPDPVDTEQTLLPADTAVEDGQQVRRQRCRLCRWYLWPALIVVAVATIVGLSFFFVFAKEQNWWKNSDEYNSEHMDWEWCQVIYDWDEWDEMDEAENSTEVRLPQLEERVQVLEDYNVELIQVPEFKFSGSVPANVVHDFDKNLTAFLDLTMNKCYVAPLNTSSVLLPRDLQELISNVTAGIYLPQFHLVYEQLVVTGPLDDVEKLGPFISDMCDNYETFRLEHKTATAGIQKREALNCRRIRHFENMYVTETQICEL